MKYVHPLHWYLLDQRFPDTPLCSVPAKVTRQECQRDVRPVKILMDIDESIQSTKVAWFIYITFSGWQRSWLRCIVFVQKFREDNLEWETSSTRISNSSENLDELKPLIEAEGQQVWNQGSKMSSCQWAAKAIISSQISKRSVQWSMNTNSKPFLETENEH